jgi:hypothetical protein
MSVYTRNSVYNYVYDKVIQAFPDAYVSGMYEPVVPSFPAVFIREIGNFSNPENVTFGGSQDVWTSTFEVQIQSNKIDTPMSEVYEIFSVIKEAFSSLFYTFFSLKKQPKPRKRLQKGKPQRNVFHRQLSK